MDLQESERELATQRAADALTEHLSGSGDWSRATPKMAEVALNAAEVVPRSEAEALAEALEVVVAYLRTDERRPLHTTIGQTCGTDICIVCAAEANAREALDEYRLRHSKETP